jgi:alkylated DNA repair dioxygenase AlkB
MREVVTERLRTVRPRRVERVASPLSRGAEAPPVVRPRARTAARPSLSRRPRAVIDPRVVPVPQVAFQPSLFDGPPTTFDATFSEVRRIWLDERAWVDHAVGWVRGSDALFDAVLRSRRWGLRSRWMYERRVLEPRLTSPWSLDSAVPLEPAVLEELRIQLSLRYGVLFDSAGFNLYRDGRDSVAWHADRIEKQIRDPVIALVVLGEPRPFLMRPRPPRGGGSIRFPLGRGDLLVTGGATTRSWEHSVPKVAFAGPRISVAYRHGLDPGAYRGKRVEPER